MKGRIVLLFVFPVACAASYVILRIFVVTDVRLLETIFRVGATLVAFVGCAAAAVQFERGDFLRTGWMLQGIGYLCLTTSALWRVYGPKESVTVVRAGLTLGSNLAEVVGTILFARTWLVAGIELPGSRLGRRGVVALAIVVALATAGLPLALGVRDIVHGKVSGYIATFSSLGDMISLCLIAPILLTALALRGGVVAWPWTFWTLTMLAWLLFDAQDIVGFFAVGVDQPNPEWLLIAVEPFRIFACGFTLAAGLTQRWISAGAA